MSLPGVVLLGTAEKATRVSTPASTFPAGSSMLKGSQAALLHHQALRVVPGMHPIGERGDDTTLPRVI
jgi:hypothetical protein